MSDLRSTIRQVTAPAHQQLDAVLSVAAPFSSTANYHRYLLATWDLYAQFGKLLDRSSEIVGLPVNSAAMSEQLANDIAQLSGSEFSEASAPLLSDPSSEQFNDFHVVGIGYTLEGSAMGATQLVSQARRVLGEATPCGFLARLAEGTKTRWPVFADSLRRQPAEAIEDACSGALEVFQAAESAYRAHFRLPE